ncbi:putative O-antigen transporter protein [Marine Group I thaumarchaeote SCGC AAA799-E16]|uniref:Polysaccharide biosynthesis protein n=2 Tax=Marine Group I TaxID=905826 RepID=A0A087S245_9ARCH|nr:putative O-antigen transporter protein [Marine Group I thaumarchaeote SCGC AAA799-E16]KFM19799.1 Polysaccharide biosynthesis protein [Marine Group I thaumarchaeote SCGC RSA3]
MSSISKNIVVVFMAELIPSILSFVFIIFVSNFTGPEIVGIMGFIITFSALLVNISSIEIHIGMKRHLGKSVSEKNWPDFKQVSSTSFLFTMLTSIVTLIIFLNPFVFNLYSFDIDYVFVGIISLLVIGSNLHRIFIGIFTSALKSSPLLLSSLFSSILRFIPIALFIYLNELNAFNVSWSYSIFYVGIIASLLLFSRDFFKQIKGKSIGNVIFNTKLILKASVPRWISGIVGTLGAKLNLLVIFSIHGASESGLFFIPWSILGVLIMLLSSITQIVHPVFSGIKESEQTILLKRVTKFGYLTTIPITVIVYFYSGTVLTIFSSDFVVANEILSILLISFPLLVLNDIVYYLFYARGKYNYIFYIGIAATIPRVILYYLLVPEFGNIGAAWAFTTGTFIQTAMTLVLIKKSKIKLQYLDYLWLTLIPFVIGFAISQTTLGILGSILIFIFSYVLFLKLKLLSDDDMDVFLQLFSSHEQSLERKKKIVKILKQYKIY